MVNRSCVSINLGQAGVQAGNSCWELYCLEHGVDKDGRVTDFSDSLGREGFDTFFNEMENGQFVPKAIFADSEPSVVDEVRSGEYSKLFNPDNIISGTEDCANNFARGFYSNGNRLTKRVVEAVRRMAERDEGAGLQGFILCNSLGGGTGSGITPRLLQEINDRYKKKCRLQLSVYPAPQIASSIVEPYNAVLTTHECMDLIDCAFMVDNEALSVAARDRLGVCRPTFGCLNRLIGQVASSLTTSLRFPGTLNVDLADFQTNLVPFPRIHFPLMSYAPIIAQRCSRHETQSVADMTASCFDESGRMVRCDPSKGRYIACCLLYRGDVVPKEVNSAIAAIKNTRRVYFVDWCPTGFKVGINNKPAARPADAEMAASPRSVCLVSNTTAISQAWRRLAEKFDPMFAKRAFLHWYEREGAGEDLEGKFQQAREDLEALIMDYEEVEKDYYDDLGPNDSASKAALDEE